jgi:hypothetical protein
VCEKRKKVIKKRYRRDLCGGNPTFINGVL